MSSSPIPSPTHQLLDWNISNLLDHPSTCDAIHEEELFSLNDIIIQSASTYKQPLSSPLPNTSTAETPTKQQKQQQQQQPFTLLSSPQGNTETSKSPQKRRRSVFSNGYNGPEHTQGLDISTPFTESNTGERERSKSVQTGRHRKELTQEELEERARHRQELEQQTIDYWEMIQSTILNPNSQQNSQEQAAEPLSLPSNQETPCEHYTCYHKGGGTCILNGIFQHPHRVETTHRRTIAPKFCPERKNNYKHKCDICGITWPYEDKCRQHRLTHTKQSKLVSQ